MAEKQTVKKEEKKVDKVKAKELADRIQDYFNGHYRLDHPDLIDIQVFLNSL